MPISRSEMARRIPREVYRTRVGRSAEHELTYIRMTLAASRKERRTARGRARPSVRAFIHEKLHHRKVPSVCRMVQGRQAEGIRIIYVGSVCLDKVSRRIQPAVACS
jgi:hypothetical protein